MKDTERASNSVDCREMPPHKPLLTRPIPPHGVGLRRVTARSAWGVNWGVGFVASRQTNRLTAVEIAAAKDGQRLQDGGGLMLDKSSTGGRWTYRYSFAGQRREMGLGSLPGVTLAKARKAREKWAAALQDGKDPITERARQIEAERVAMTRVDPTFAEVLDIVFDSHKTTLRGDGERGRWLSPLRVHVLPKMGAKRISTLHQADIRDALKPIWRTKPATAQKAMERIGIVLRKAPAMGIECPSGLVEAARQMLGNVTETPVSIPATRWQDVPALFARLPADNTSHLALRFVILTACRFDSVSGARFSEIDGNVWTVPPDRMKGREGKARAFRVPLSDAALAVVERCRGFAENDLLFPGIRRGPITEAALRKTLNDMGETGRTHGFRTSFRTWCQDEGAGSRDVAEMCLAHKVYGKTESAYARSDLLDQRADLMQRWADHVTGAAAKVVPLRAG
jgi:integrase